MNTAGVLVSPTVKNTGSRLSGIRVLISTRSHQSQRKMTSMKMRKESQIQTWKMGETEREEGEIWIENNSEEGTKVEETVILEDNGTRRAKDTMPVEVTSSVEPATPGTAPTDGGWHTRSSTVA
ncbi:unnamed protein product [Lactuca saligna]|uniref:Uncharacterized protein n=1 Tax=Lactuca saligna TaxID=75948 RepID=A0AA35Y7D9_LACSI|nr:unnamed protein product [Lactuca saligna]